MNEKKHPGVSKSFFIGLFSIAALGLLASGYGYYLHEMERIILEEHREIAAVGELKANEIVQWRRERLGNARRAVESPFFRRALEQWRQSPEIPNVRAEWQKRLEIEKQSFGYEDALLVDPGGNILLSAKDDPDPINPVVKQTIEAAIAGRKAVLSDFHRCPKGIVHIDVAAPVFDAQEHVSAVLVLHSNAEAYLFPLIQSWPGLRPSPSAETLLAQREGKEVVFLNNLRHRSDTALMLRFPITQSDLPAVQAVLGKRGIFEGTDYRGVQVLADLRPVPESPWFMVAKVDLDEVMAQRRANARMIALFVLLGIMLAAAMFAYAYRQRQAGLYRDLFKSEQAGRQAEEEIRATLYGIGDGVIATDVSGCVARMNPMAEQLTGWSEAESLGKPVTDVFVIINEQTRAGVENPVTRVLREGRVVGLANHTILIARDGTERPISDSGAPIVDGQGRISGVVLVFRDQGAERAAQKILEESEEKYRLLADNTLDCIWLMDMNLVFQYVNPAIYDLTGYTPEEWIGSRISDHCDEKNLQLIMATGQKHIDRLPDNSSVILEVGIIRKNGGTVPIELVAKLLLDENGRPTGMQGVTRDITERKQAAKELQKQTLFFEQMFMQSSISTQILDKDGWCERINPRLSQIFGVMPEHMEGRVYNIFEDEGIKQGGVILHLEKVFKEGKTAEWEVYYDIGASSESLNIPVKEKKKVWYHNWAYPIFDEKGNLSHAIIQHTDISARKQAEEEQKQLQDQLLQSQKMESVGRLAGGVAHDFNNMLQAIIGYADLALERAQGDQALSDNIREILKAAHRSADLTRQLLAFARKQTVSPKVLDLNETVSGMLKMLRRLIGEDIKLVFKPGPDLWPIKIDPSQIDQIMANLSVNARDAIASVGNLTIETDNVVFDETYARTHAGFIPGEYVLLAVKDDGCGMDKQTLDVLFEPFFTTKDVGKGTGLGLATVYGIVRQNNGFINAYSEPGLGTAFNIYLPRAPSMAAVRPETMEKKPASGAETVLLVEDDVSILNLGKEILSRFGYTVLAAHNPNEALALAERHADPIHLLVTDVVMPEMNGKDLKDRLVLVRPEMKVLYMSGYTANLIAHHGVIDEDVRFLQKPFSVNSLATKVRETLDENDE